MVFNVELSDTEGNEFKVTEVTPEDQQKINNEILAKNAKIKGIIDVEKYKTYFIGPKCLINGEKFSREFLIDKEGQAVGELNYDEAAGRVWYKKYDKPNIDNQQLVEDVFEAIKYEPEIINDTELLLKIGSYYFNIEWLNLMINVIPFKEELLEKETNDSDKQKLKEVIACHKEQQKEIEQKILKYFKKIVELEPNNPLALNNYGYMLNQISGDTEITIKYYELAIQNYADLDDETRLSNLSTLSIYFFKKYEETKDEKLKNEFKNKAKKYASDYLENVIDNKGFLSAFARSTNPRVTKEGYFAICYPKFNKIKGISESFT